MTRYATDNDIISIVSVYFTGIPTLSDESTRWLPGASFFSCACTGFRLKRLASHSLRLALHGQTHLLATGTVWYLFAMGIVYLCVPRIFICSLRRQSRETRLPVKKQEAFSSRALLVCAGCICHIYGRHLMGGNMSFIHVKNIITNGLCGAPSLFRYDLVTTTYI